MIVEIDEIAVDENDWVLAKAGDMEAIERIRKSVDGLELYFHCLIMSPDPNKHYKIVTLRELQELLHELYVFVDAPTPTH